ncbi:MAG: diphosphate--fructose-6-phosphate 1-phosphotransferase [Bacilli bacterium]|nr:diphosphate--fructose-6-phosphate 1-phosphotransferase [Bacilli bacterium]
MKNSLIIQSGGPTPVINSSLYGIIKESKKIKSIIYGSKNGILGLINDDLVNLNDLDEENLELLKQTPGAILGSARYCLKDFNHQDYELIKNNIIKYHLSYIYVIGGNDSMDTANKLALYCFNNNLAVKVIGVPKTIDNDLLYTDHTPGFGSALKYVVNTLACVKEDVKCYKNGKVTIVEIMGRDTGWLTAGSVFANPDLIYLPESNFNLDNFLKDVNTIYQQKKYCLVCVSEGIKLSNENDKEIDQFGHTQLGGVSLFLANLVKEKLNISSRAIELSIPQRCSSFIASKVDVKEAIKCGQYAVKYALKDYTNKMVIMKRNKEYAISYKLENLDNIANGVKYFPTSWIINNNYISDAFKTYAFPLMQKELKIKYQNGIIKHSKIKD